MPTERAAEDDIDGTGALVQLPAAPVAKASGRLHGIAPRPRASLVAQLLAARLDAPAYRSRRREDPAIAGEAYRAAAMLGRAPRNRLIEDA